MNLMVPELMAILKRICRLLGAGGPIAVATLLLAALTGCNTTKFLAEDQELLTSYRIKLEDPKEVDNRADVTYELSTLARQTPNTNFLGVWPREQFYLDNNKPKDTTRIDRFLRNTLGQPPTIYSDSLSRLSAADMTTFLRYLGYFNAYAYHEADRGKRRKVDLIYHVNAGRRFLIDSVDFSSPDPLLDSLLRASLSSSELRPGEPLDLNKFDREKARISSYLRNQGFAFFSGTYFDKLEIDTSRRRGYADVYLSILPPQKEAAYARYRVGTITVLTDFSPLAPGGGYRLDTTINGVRFLSDEPSFRIRPEVLRNSIFLQPGAYHQRADLEKTNVSLNALGIYRFVRINQQIDTTQEQVLNYQVQLTPSDRMSLGADLDLNYTNRNGNVGAGNLIGLSLTPVFQNRNVFGGAELLVTSLRAGVEVNPAIGTRNSAFFNTIDLSADVSLYLPRFRDFGLYSFLNKLPSPFGKKVLSDNFINTLEERASTRYSLGYEYLSIRNFYAYTLLNARLGYDFNRSATTSYRINHLAIDILAPQIEPDFDLILDQNEFLRRSIGEQYFLSVFFRNLEYTRNGQPDRRGRSLSFNGQFELAGAEVSLFNEVLNLFGEDQVIKPNQNATFAKYALALADVRYQKQYTPLKVFASRFLVAAGRPYGGSAAVPYVKQFFSGGANSMRAWAPRALGPGGYVDTLSLSTTNNLQLFQTGDFRMELNLEYRFPIASFFRGALFADIGNIWTFDEDLERPGSQFLLSKRPNADGSFVAQPFYRQLAMGVGTGLRTDLSYFIFRLDVSLPVRYNYPQDGYGTPLVRDGNEIPEAAYWRKFDRLRLRDLTFQLGLGYPF